MVFLKWICRWFIFGFVFFEVKVGFVLYFIVFIKEDFRFWL